MKLVNNIIIWKYLGFLDWAIFLSALFLTLLSVLYGFFWRKKNTSSQGSWADYILMGRQLTLPLFVATLVSTWYGSILGVTQLAFEQGIYNFVTQGLFWYISYLTFAVIFVKKVRKLNIITFPDILLKFIGPGPAKFSAVLIFLKTLPITYTISIGIFLKMLLGVSFFSGVLIGLGFVFFYSIFGGFSSIVFSDFVQFILMYMGIICVVGFSVAHFGGINYLLHTLPASHFSFFGNFTFLDTFVWFFIATSTTFLNPTFYQRCLAATSDKVAIKGIFISTFFWLGFDICTTAIGLYAKAALPHAHPLDASLTYCLQILPAGFKGLFLASIVATLLSTLDSFLFIASTVLSYDLRLIGFKRPYQNHLLSLLITSILTLFIVMIYEGNIELIWRTLKGTFASCLFCPLIFSFFKPGSVSARGFGLSCTAVLISTLLWQIYTPLKLDSFYVGLSISLLFLIFSINIGDLKKSTSVKKEVNTF